MVCSLHFGGGNKQNQRRFCVFKRQRKNRLEVLLSMKPPSSLQRQLTWPQVNGDADLVWKRFLQLLLTTSPHLNLHLKEPRAAVKNSARWIHGRSRANFLFWFDLVFFSFGRWIGD